MPCSMVIDATVLAPRENNLSSSFLGIPLTAVKRVPLRRDSRPAAGAHDERKNPSVTSTGSMQALCLAKDRK